MKKRVRRQRILILSLLSISIFVPVILFSIFTSSHVHKGLVEDLTTIKYKTETLQMMNSIEQEIEKELKEPTLALYKNETFVSDENVKSFEINETFGNARGTDGGGLDKNQTRVQSASFWPFGKGNSRKLIAGERDVQSQTLGARDEKVREIKDQVIMAKAYLKFSSQDKNSQLTKELKTRIRELDRAVGEALKDSDLSRSALQKMKSMEATLYKAGKIYTDCPAMATKFRAMTYNTEEELRASRNQANYLVELAARTTPKGLHCLSLQLVADYFELQPEEREFQNQQNLHDPDLYHYVLFSDNILASAAVVNSTVSTSSEPGKMVFHLVTDDLNFLSMRMWFLLNPPGQATIEIESIANIDSLPSKSVLKKKYSLDPRYFSPLNHLRFYLPEIFPALNKVVFLDHDVVVQRDLRGLWDVNMKGMVNGAVETCQKDQFSYRRMDMLINFRDPFIAKSFDVKSCTWAFGMNVFDLREWRRHNLTRAAQRVGWVRYGLYPPPYPFMNRYIIKYNRMGYV
ncbi:probable galacturonosyltransferase 6 [Papaver somniferum]|uniref:probable galacturonosyltransferase 6 n=1 Tax=Papaver somniferum TaxID=3469 RepID=UPI000E705D7A|nr:probable galacturonosyltransferase 6 [Papaver somniferum]